MTLAGLRPGEKLYEEKLMAEEGLTKTENGLPIPPYAVYNIGNSHPENLLEFVDILQQELIRAGVLPEDYDFEAHAYGFRWFRSAVYLVR